MELCPESLWTRLCHDDPSSTFFQTPAWHALAAACEGTQSHPLLFDFGDIQVVLPLQKRSRFWGRVHLAPFGTYTALLCPSSLDPDSLQIIARELCGLNIDIPGSPFTKNPLPSVDPPVSQTRILRLENLQPDGWIQGWSRNHRRCLRNAQTAGFRVRLAETPEDVARYHAVYRGQVERWGRAARRTYPEAFFQEAFSRLAPGGSLRLWLAELEGQVVAGRTCLYHGFHSVEWHAAATPDAMEKGVNHLLVHAAVLHAREAGFGIYDFNPNPGLEAVGHFKRGFGAEAIKFQGFRNSAGLGIAMDAVRKFRHGFS